MLVTLDRNSGTPVFRQICEQVRFQVAAGVLRVGDELPSTRELAAVLGINPMTVSKAYSQLEQDEILERRPGLALVVREGSRSGGACARRDELARLLAPVAVAARQLGVPAAEAIELFRRVLRSSGEPS